MVIINNKRLLELDSFRGIAALLVLFFHLSVSSNTLNFRYGNTAVDFFFMISGFVIVMSFKNETTVSSFWKSRFIRLYPTYWVSIIIAIFTYLIFKVTFSVKINDIIGNVSMLQPLFKASYWVDAYWTLYVELNFYIFISLNFYINRLKNIERIIFFFLAFCAAINFTYSFFGTFSPFYTRYFIVFRDIFPLISHFHMFAVGIIFFKIYKEGITVERFLILLLSLLTTILVHSLGGKIFYFLNVYEHFIAVLIYALMMYLMIKNKLSFIVNKLTLFLGTISYSLYVVHQSIGLCIMLFLLKYIPAMFALGVGLITSLGVAAIASYYFEKPIILFLKSRSYAKTSNSNSLL